MGSKCIRTLSNRWLRLVKFAETQSIVDVSSFVEPLLTNQKWRSYCRWCPRQLNKTRDTKISNSFNMLSPPSVPLSTSSSETSPPKIGLMAWYLGKLDSHSITTKAITASLTYVAADLTAQMITLPPSGTIDPVRTLRMAAYGMLALGPSQHFWFNSVSKILPKQDTVTTLKKILMGQAMYGPTMTTVFFSYNAALEGKNTIEIEARLKRDLVPTLVRGVMYWPICDFITFKFLPVHLQPILNSACSYVWTIYLTYMATRDL